MSNQQPLFPLPPGSRKPKVKIVILTGPSGSGKTSLTTRLGLPSLSLDSFYKNDDEPELPRVRGSQIDWDHSASWHEDQALEALVSVALTGRAEIPVYDIPSNRRTGMTQFDAGNNRVVVVEGIFASELVNALKQEGLLLGAICIARSPLRNAWFRLARDLGEARKPIPVLLRRGWGLLRQEPVQVRKWVADGCEPAKSLGEAERRIRFLANS